MFARPSTRLPTLTIGDQSLQWGTRTFVMGILNVTPDSFSGDGLAGRPTEGLVRALQMERDGADLLDIGAESTRPGHTPVDADEELRRLRPAFDALRGRLRIPITVDTSKAAVAAAALDAGAAGINDISGMTADPQMAELVARRGVPVVVMHIRRRGGELMRDVIDTLEESCARAERAGIRREHVIVDPGIGFGKTHAENLEILRRLDELRVLQRPLLVGTSRKGLIGMTLDLPVDQRIEGTAATVALAIAGGADLVRVHDVREMVRVARMTDAIVRGA
jgi:dihydropteroate synthase